MWNNEKVKEHREREEGNVKPRKLNRKTGHVMCKEFLNEYFMRLFVRTILRLGIGGVTKHICTMHTHIYEQANERTNECSTVKYIYLEWLCASCRLYVFDFFFVLASCMYPNPYPYIFIFHWTNIKRLGCLFDAKKNSKHETMTRVFAAYMKLLLIHSTATLEFNSNFSCSTHRSFHWKLFLFLRTNLFFLIKTIFSPCLFSMIHEQAGARKLFWMCKNERQQCAIDSTYESQVFYENVFFVFSNTSQFSQNEKKKRNTNKREQ